MPANSWRMNRSKPARTIKRPVCRVWVSTIAGGAALLAVLGIWHSRLRDRVNVLSRDLSLAQERWAVVSSQLRECQEAQPALQRLIERPQAVSAVRAAPRWTGALRAVVASSSEETEMKGIHAFEAPETPGACELRLQGVAGGGAPRATAERFRQLLLMNLAQCSVPGSVGARFENLEDVTSAALVPSPWVTAFTIVATAHVQGRTTLAKGELK